MCADVTVERVTTFADSRGELLKILPFPVTGEVYVVSLEPGASRGHHLHRRANEWFVGLEGNPTLVVETAAGRRLLPLQGRRVRVPAGLAHALFATERALVACAMDHGHDPEDVVAHPVEAP